MVASGQLVASLGSKQSVEIKADSVTLIGGCEPDTYPLQKVTEHLCVCVRECEMEEVRV